MPMTPADGGGRDARAVVFRPAAAVVPLGGAGAATGPRWKGVRADFRPADGRGAGPRRMHGRPVRLEGGRAG